LFEKIDQDSSNIDNFLKENNAFPPNYRDNKRKLKNSKGGENNGSISSSSSNKHEELGIDMQGKSSARRKYINDLCTKKSSATMGSISIDKIKNKGKDLDAKKTNDIIKSSGARSRGRPSNSAKDVSFGNRGINIKQQIVDKKFELTKMFKDIKSAD